MEAVIGAASLGVAALAAIIAIWQGVMARRQLKLAEETQGRTERTLSEIRDVSRETKAMVEDMKAENERTIKKMIDSQIESKQTSDAQSAKFAELFMTQLLSGGNSGGPAQN